MKLLPLLVSIFSIKFVESQVSSILHPALYEGPQSEVVPSLFYPNNRVGQRNRLRSRVFRDASQGYKNLVESPRLFRASGRFHKRVQSATTHDIQTVPLPQDSLQIVSYKYDAEKHNEKKMANSNDIVTNAEIEDVAKGIERTTMSVKLLDGEEETTTPMTPETTQFVPSSTTVMPEQNSINEVKDIPNDSGPNSINNGNMGQQRSKTFFQTVTASGVVPQPGTLLPPQPPVVFSPPPPISPPTFTMPSLLPQPQQPIQQQNLPQPQTFSSNQPLGLNSNLNPINNIPHQPSSPLIPPPPPTGPQFQQQPSPVIQPSPNPSLALGIPTNHAILPPPSQSGLVNVDDKNLGGGQGLTQNPDLQHQQQQQQASNSHEQLGCGWDWLTNSCKDVFVLNWCGKCHDFGNIFLHDCKCVAPLIPLPTTSRPSSPQVPQPSQLSQLSQLSQQPLPVQPVPPPPQRNPLFFWLI